MTVIAQHLVLDGGRFLVCANRSLTGDVVAGCAARDCVSGSYLAALGNKPMCAARVLHHVLRMGKKNDKGNHVGRAGDMEQRKDQASQMRGQDARRAEQRGSRDKRNTRNRPTSNKKSK
jgi:hypothetical protein